MVGGPRTARRRRRARKGATDETGKAIPSAAVYIPARSPGAACASEDNNKPKESAKQTREGGRPRIEEGENNMADADLVSRSGTFKARDEIPPHSRIKGTRIEEWCVGREDGGRGGRGMSLRELVQNSGHSAAVVPFSFKYVFPFPSLFFFLVFF